jgi:ribosomal subunit interface protein
MPLRVSGKNLDIGDSLRTHISEKVQTLIARYFDGNITGHVVITPEGSAYRTDCSLHLSSGMNLQSEGRAHEPYASFEQAADKIERRLRKYKKRLKEHASGHDDEAAVVEPREVAKFVIAAPAEDEEEEGSADYAPVVVAEDAQPLKTLSVASAVFELDFSGAPVVVFQHASSLRVNIVYRRRDGAIGWLDPR